MVVWSTALLWGVGANQTAAERQRGDRASWWYTGVPAGPAADSSARTG